MFQSTLPRGERPLTDQSLNIIRHVSIHAPAWGATRCGRFSHIDSGVSIHAPAWGATARAASAAGAPCFNPRSRVGSDEQYFIDAGDRSMFQSTLPRGERLIPTFRISRPFMFQSTLPRGERQEDIRVRLGNGVVSIHAPAWGATIHATARNYHVMFQSTLPRGERRGC